MENGSFLTDNACHSNGTLAGKCSVYATDGGCRVCNASFYRHEKACVECMSECRTCGDSVSCQTCNELHFMSVDGECRSKGEIVGCAVEVSSEYGCTSCLPGFFSKDRTCAACNATHTDCVQCDEDACGACVADYVLSSGACLHFKNVAHCTAADNSKCTKCSFWHKPSADGLSCQTHAVWWVILVAVLVVLFALAVVVVVVVVVVNAVMRRFRAHKQSATTCIFKMARSNVSFIPTHHPAVCVDKTTVVFEGTLPVDAETKALLCVGNKGRKHVKVQFIAKDGSDKFALRTEPTTVTLSRGMACEFEVFLSPLCSCTVDDKALLVVREGGASTSTTVPLGIKAETEVTTKLHYDDVVCEKQIGEGSFGVVFKGTFRGNDVAIKKMKEVDASEASMAEFEKEVAMLDKFRCDQIVHFYGACFIPNHVMMVTEFAPCGSLMDCIMKRAEPAEMIKVKLMLDAAKGLAYLHANGILHRDIKPDNVLVFSLGEVLDVNGKLTDFGSSRNVNMLMTNMTFTKGVGTPVYMAPEVINKQKYKKPADVYSFGVMMFECFKWGEAYPKAQFKFPWQISAFVQSGERLSQQDGVSDPVFALIQRCWAHDPKDRIGLVLFCLISRNHSSHSNA